MAVVASNVQHEGVAARERGRGRVGWVMWAVFALALAAMILLRSDPGSRSVTPEYHRAAIEWWQGTPIYTAGVHGFLYLPQAAMLYSPFAVLPARVEEIAWRWAGLGLLAAGVYRLLGRLFHDRRGMVFAIATGLSIISALGSASNGQTNIHLAGLFALCCADLIGRRWWRVAIWLAVALACKPTAIVMVLLVGAVYLRPMGWRLAVILGVFALLPFAHPDPAYVVGQHQACLTKMGTAAEPIDAFQDIRGMLMEFGLVRVERVPVAGGEEVVRQTPPTIVFTLVRAVAALGVLGACLLASIRFGDRGRAMVLYTLGAVYLTLFNPRTEGLSYVLLGVPAAIWAVRELLERRWGAAAFFVFFALSTQFSTQIALNTKNYWVRPLGAAVLGTLVLVEIARPRSRWDTRDDGASEAGA